jgi:hypothetical protein
MGNFGETRAGKVMNFEFWKFQLERNREVHSRKPSKFEEFLEKAFKVPPTIT